eukprot:gene24401-biopygen2907
MGGRALGCVLRKFDGMGGRALAADVCWENDGMGGRAKGRAPPIIGRHFTVVRTRMDVKSDAVVFCIDTLLYRIAPWFRAQAGASDDSTGGGIKYDAILLIDGLGTLLNATSVEPPPPVRRAAAGKPAGKAAKPAAKPAARAAKPAAKPRAASGAATRRGCVLSVGDVPCTPHGGHGGMIW